MHTYTLYEVYSTTEFAHHLNNFSAELTHCLLRYFMTCVPFRLYVSFKCIAIIQVYVYITNMHVLLFVVLMEMSNLLNTGLDADTLAICVRLCENGVNPEALAMVIQELRRASTEYRVFSFDWSSYLVGTLSAQ